MTMFGSDVTQAPATPSYDTVKEGVVKRPLLLDGVSDVFGMATEFASRAKASRKEQALNDLFNKQVTLADAYAQGIGTRASTMTRMRQNVLEAVASGMNYKDVAEVMKSMDIMGIAQTVDEGTREEQIREAREDALIKDGYLDPNDRSDNAYLRADAEARSEAAIIRRYEETNRAIDLEMSSLGLTNARRKELEAQRVENTRTMVRGSSSAAFSRVSSALEAIVSGPGTEAEKAQAVERKFSEWQMGIMPEIANLPPDERALYMKPFEDMREVYRKRAMGEYTDAEMKREIERNIGAQKLILTSDPELARVIALQESIDLGAMAGLVSGGAFNRIGEIIKGTMEGNPTNPFSNGEENVQALDQLFKQTSEALKSGDQGKVDNANEILAGLLDSISYHGQSIKRNPKSAIALTEAMASPTFLLAIKNSNVPKEVVDAAADAIAQDFSNEVWGMVRDEFTNKNVRLQADDPTVAPGAEGSSVRVNSLVVAVPTETGINFIPSDYNSPDQVTLARNLNKELKPIINKTIRASAHLKGSSDYKSEMEAAFPTFFGEEFIGGGDEGDELNLQDFQDTTQGGSGTDTLGVVPASASGVLSLVDRVEGSGSYDTLYDNSQKGNRRFSGVDVTNMTISEVLDFQKSGGEYGRWVKANNPKGDFATPVGRYQIVGTTLRRVAKEMGLSPDTKFTKEVQDAMFLHLLDARLKRGGTMKEKISQLRQEWDGFNRLSDEILRKAIEQYEAA